MTRITRYMLCALVTACLFIFPVMFVIGAEPVKPDVKASFDERTEKAISEMSGIAAGEAFERMKKPPFLFNDKMLYKAIHKGFNHRRDVVIDRALNAVRGQTLGIRDGILRSSADDLYVARKVFEVFPRESAARLLSLYDQGDAVMRGNIIRASGMVAEGRVVKSLLLRALDDRTFCEDETEETLGEPMRICDMAYNQLVLRYQVRNVLRTIGTVHRLDVRDFHISVLKGML